MSITLVLGGARSGKSVVAEGVAAAGRGPITFVATARVDRADPDHVARVAAHQARRPGDWATVEAGDDLPAALIGVDGTALVDSLGTWISSALDGDPDVDGLVAALRQRRGDTVLVSEEVGLGVHPSSELGRRFRDVLGEVNRAVADVADRAVLVVAGRVIPLERSPW
jgi:adenosyl cobinamide kinase/adenosyl cobinamide phosphate guanylyltransferase